MSAGSEIGNLFRGKNVILNAPLPCFILVIYLDLKRHVHPAERRDVYTLRLFAQALFYLDRNRTSSLCLPCQYICHRPTSVIYSVYSAMIEH